MAIAIELEIVSFPGHTALEGQIFQMASGDDIVWTCSPICFCDCTFTLHATDRNQDTLEIVITDEPGPNGAQTPVSATPDDDVGSFVSDFQYSRPGAVPDRIDVQIRGTGMPIPFRGLRVMRHVGFGGADVEIWDEAQTEVLHTTTSGGGGVVDLIGVLPSGTYRVRVHMEDDYEVWTTAVVAPNTLAHCDLAQLIQPGY